MFLNILLYSPLEQFQIVPIFPFFFGIFDFSITNETVILFLLLFFFIVFVLSLSRNSSFSVVPGRWQSMLEIIYITILSLVNDNIRSEKSQKFFPLVFFLFFFVMSLNLIGLVPYSFTLTSHLVVTVVLSFSVFIGINIVCVRLHGLNMFSLFLPSGTPIQLALLLVPIELISYVFKPVSLSIRLFANMMAGHALLKVIAGFAYSLMSSAGLFFLMHYIPLLILIPLFGLELGVALIQAFVFSTLICIYLNDSINLH